MKFTYYGHSCFLLETNGKKLLFDPFIRQNELASEISFESIEADYILISHGHQDHTDDLIELALKTKAQVICSWEIMLWLQKKGINHVHAMNVGGKWNFDFGIVKMTFSAHSSSLPDGTYAGVAAGFLIMAENKTIYYSGDTGLNQEMKLIGEFHQPDWSILPIGGNFTMDPSDAAIAAEYLRCNQIIGIHFNTFPPIQVDTKLAKEIFNSRNKNLNIIPISASIQL